MKNRIEIHKDVNRLLRFYQGKRSYNRRRSTLLSLNLLTGYAEAPISALILGGFFVTVTSLLTSPLVPVSLFCYNICGHTHKARVQPIEKLLSLLQGLERTEQKQSLYREKLKEAQKALPKIHQEITAFPSDSKPYQDLVNAVKDLYLHIQMRLNELDKQNAATMLNHGCCLLSSKHRYQFGPQVNEKICSFLP